MSTFDELGLPAGFLTDAHIRKALDNGQLVVPDSWDEKCIRHASYTLRLGNKVEVASAARANEEHRRDFAVRDLTNGEYMDLEPGDTAKLYSIEILSMPDSVLGFTVARGLMFFEALVPENTYVDPGFKGPLYTTITNLSQRVVRLHYNDPIARLFFYHLAEPVMESYRQGAVKGLKQRLESKRFTDFGTPTECGNAATGQLQKELRKVPMAGNQLVELVKRQNRRWIALFGFSVFWPALLVLANTNSWIRQTLGWVGSNLAALLLSALCSYFVPKIWSKLSKL